METEMYGKKLDYVNSELYKLQQRCIDHKKTNSDIATASKPFADAIKSKENNRSVLFLILNISICVGVASLLIYNDSVSKLFWVFSRLAALKVLPLWDWRQLYSIQCFLPNPLTNDTELLASLEDCQVCMNLSQIAVLSTTSQEEMSKTYIDQNVPVIVTAAHQGDRFIQISVLDLYQLYSEDETLKLYFACEFLSDIQVYNNNHRTLLKKIHEEHLTQYYAHWQNCFKESAKAIRQLYRRPAYLPSTIELADSNWIFISKDARLKQKPLPVPMPDEFMMLIQLSGHVDVTLTPVDVCSGICSEVTATLHAGSVLLFTDLLYNATYTPSSGEESLTVGMGGTYDY